MKVHVISFRVLRQYARYNIQGVKPIDVWINSISKADLRAPEDILNRFPSADLLGAGSQRVVFDLGGNKYRLICKYRFGENVARLYVCWIGTHHEYNQLCRKGGQYTISNY